MSRIGTTVRVASALAGIALFGCKADTTGLDTLTIAQLGALLKVGPEVVLCDANTPKTRSQYGIIPGAQLLSNYRDYDPAVELPADRGQPFVFYCHSEMCGAAAGAARKAVAAGLERVYLLPVGIVGWVAAGRPVQELPAG